MFRNPEATRLSRNRLRLIRAPDGSEVVLNEELHGTDADGNPEVRETQQLFFDPSGRVLTPNELGIYCRSWTGHMTPEWDHGLCAMCQIEYGRKRYVYLGLDGSVTEEGNCLCHECWPVNETRKRRIRRFFGLIRETIY